MMRKWHLLLGALLLLVFTSIPSLAEAHGTDGRPILINARSNDFIISAWLAPDPLVPDVDSHLAVALSVPGEGSVSSAGQIVLDAQMGLTITPLDANTDPIRREMGPVPAGTLFYEADLMFLETGRYDLALTIQHPSGSGSVSTEIEVVNPPLQINWLLVGGISVVVLAVGWFIWQSRQAAEPTA